MLPLRPVPDRAISSLSQHTDDLEADDEGKGAAAEQDPEAAAHARAEVQRLLEEYFKLDYEDVVGGIPTRFRCGCGRCCGKCGMLGGLSQWMRVNVTE